MNNFWNPETVEARQAFVFVALFMARAFGNGRAILWNANLTDANLRDADLTRASLTRANLTGASLTGASLMDATGWRANLTGASLTDANLTRADLDGADLRDANLRNASLRYANLRNANLRNASLTDANLEGADLTRANLTDADLTGADLRYADLTDADLTDADLTRADFTGTCLDPGARIPSEARRRVTDAFEVDADDYLLAWRTASSMNGHTSYEPGKTYAAPVFSVSDETDCHPGIYFATREWLENEYPDEKYVQVRVHIDDALGTMGGKFRCRKLAVIG